MSMRHLRRAKLPRRERRLPIRELEDMFYFAEDLREYIREELEERKKFLDDEKKKAAEDAKKKQNMFTKQFGFGSMLLTVMVSNVIMTAFYGYLFLKFLH